MGLVQTRGCGRGTGGKWRGGDAAGVVVFPACSPQCPSAWQWRSGGWCVIPGLGRAKESNKVGLCPTKRPAPSQHNHLAALGRPATRSPQPAARCLPALATMMPG